jgi:hypothetical protein
MHRLIALVLVLGMGTALMSQDADALILTYQRNFARSSLGTKLELLKEAAAYKDVEMGPLYETALRFVIENAVLLSGDGQLREAALIAAQRAGERAYAKSVDSLWSVFHLYPKDQELRAVIVTALGRAGAGEQRVVDNLNAFLAAQNTLFRSGAVPEYPALAACVDALGLLARGSSFPVLFSAYVAGYNESVSAKAAAALGAIEGDYLKYLTEVLAKNSPLEKGAALRVGLANPNFGPEQRGVLAEAALQAGLDWVGSSPVDLAAIRALKVQAVKEIRAQGWQKASPLVVRHYRNLMTDYNEGRAPQAELLEAIACLGVMGSTEAAQALALHLQIMNARTEQGGSYDEELLLAVIGALGVLGDKTAFDYLLYIGYLQYPDSVKRAARDALQRLKW